MYPLAEVLLLLSLAALGVFVGAMLTEAAILVPYWRSLAAPAFLSWYAANDKRMLGFFAPLTTAALVGAVAAALFAFVAGHPGRWPALAAALLLLAAAAMFPLYFQGINAHFSAGAIAPADLPDALAAWAAWHNLRIALAIAALAAALCACSARTPARRPSRALALRCAPSLAWTCGRSNPPPWQSPVPEPICSLLIDFHFVSPAPRGCKCIAFLLHLPCTARADRQVLRPARSVRRRGRLFPA